MKSTTLNRSRMHGGSRTGLLLLVALGLGFATGIYVMRRSLHPVATATVAGPADQLSDNTRAVLQQLRSPVQIRSYALFSTEATPGKLREAAARMDQLLTEFERAAGGKLIVNRFETWTDANTKSAGADGLRPLNLDQGEPAYVGLAVVQESRQETLAQIAPEFPQALEFDLARAIARVNSPPAAPPRSPAERVQAVSAEETVQRTIADAAATSFEAGQQILRDASLKQFGNIVAELDREMATAEQRLGPSVGGQIPEAARQAGLQELQAIRAKYAEKLRDVGRQSQAELEAWAKLKGR